MTLNKKEERNGARNIEELTGVLSQTLKLYEGLYTKKLKDTNGQTVETWMQAHGVERFVTKGGTKKGYTPGIIIGAWHPMMRKKLADGTYKLSVYKQKTAMYVDTDGEKYYVFTAKEAAKRVEFGGNNGTPIKRTVLCEVPDTRWSVRTINQGLMQKYDQKKWAEKTATTTEAWEQVGLCYIVMEEKSENGKTERIMMEVPKDEVIF